MSGKIAFPYSSVFISYAYDDEAELDALLNALPGRCHPFMFPPMSVEPYETVSTPIIDAIRAAPALIYVDSPTSRRSFWVIFEREVALHSEIPVYRWECGGTHLQAIAITPPAPRIAALSDQLDQKTARQILEALSERGLTLETFLDNRSTTDLVISLTEFDGVFIAFASRSSVKDVDLGFVESANEFGFSYKRLLVACLEPAGESWVPDSWDQFLWSRKVSIVDLTDGGRAFPYSRNRVDDLIVRTHWLYLQLRIANGDYYHDSEELVSDGAGGRGKDPRLFPRSD